MRPPPPLRSVRLAVGGVLFALTVLGAAAQPAATAPSAAAANETPRPRVALVLSGGGARGFAHVGVLRALHDLHVPVDMVVGVSMGAVVGGAYASGRSVDELERFVVGTSWSSIVADRPQRDELPLRRREDDLIVPSRIEFGIGRDGLALPPSTAGNAALESALHRLLPPGSEETPVHRLPLPFRSVASDLLTGELVELYQTPLFASLRASLSVPGVFEPVRVEGRLVVDGGLVRNLPVDIAKAMGADVLIAVNVGTPLAGEESLRSAFGVAQQMLHILTEQNVQRSLKELGPRDVLIAPELGSVSFLDFGAAERAMAAGRKAALALADRLRVLAVPPEAYARWEQSRAVGPAAPDAALPIARVDVEATPHAGKEAIATRFGLRAGQAATAEEVSRAASRLWASGDFERVELETTVSPLGRIVHLVPQEAGWARSRVRLGIEAVSDFADDHRFTLSALHTLAWLNSWGGELRTIARIGSQRLFASEWWQPLAPGSEWFIAPTLQYLGSSLDVYEQGRRTSRLGYSLGTVSFSIGRQFFDRGSVRIGIDRTVGRIEALVPEQPLDNARVGETARYLQFNFDTLDSLALPGRGFLLQGRLSSLSSSQAGGSPRSNSSVIGLWAFRAGTWDGHFYGEWARARGGNAPLPLGGFLRLSGTPRDSLASGVMLLGRLVMAERIAELPAGLGGSLRAGASLEVGGGFEPDDSMRWGAFRKAGSLFVAVDTRFGPLFLAAGATRGVGSSLYLFIGPFW